MTNHEFRTHNGRSILVIDYSGAREASLHERVTESSRLIASHPPKSLLILTRVANIEFNPETTKILLDHIKDNEPFSLASAVVGLGHLAKAVPIANRLTGRDLAPFDEETEALDWLAAHVPRVHEADERVRWIEHDGERLLLLDYSRCNVEELRLRIERAASIIHAEPRRSVLALNLLDNFPFGRDINPIVMEFVRNNRPYILAAAAVGLGYMKAVIPVLNRFTGRNIRAFDDAEQAKTWLVNEKRRLSSRQRS